MTPHDPTMHVTDDDLVLHYYGEMTAAEEARTAGHLGSCPACQHQYLRLQQVLTAVDQSAAFDAPDGFERVAWARLEPVLRADRPNWFAWLVRSPARLAWMAGIAVLVAGAFMAGRLSPGSTASRTATATASQLREGLLLVDLRDHLERSQMVLVELVSVDDRVPVDVSAERTRAQDLVAAGRLYRQTAAEAGDTRLVDVLDQLERVLVDIAASPSEMTGADLDAVRQRIDAGGLLFKVRVVSSDLRARERTAVQKRLASDL